MGDLYRFFLANLKFNIFPSVQLMVVIFGDDAMNNAVKANDLKWLPNGSEFLLESGDSNSNSTSKPKTHTSFSCSQDSLPEFSNNPIGFKGKLNDIIIAKLGSGQVHPSLPVLLYYEYYCLWVWPLLIKLDYVFLLNNIGIKITI